MATYLHYHSWDLANERITRMKNNIDKFFHILKINNPNPKTDLSYKNDFTLLIAVLLSAQSTDIGVNKATKELFINIDVARAPYRRKSISCVEPSLKREN